MRALGESWVLRPTSRVRSSRWRAHSSPTSHPTADLARYASDFADGAVDARRKSTSQPTETGVDRSRCRIDDSQLLLVHRGLQLSAADDRSGAEGAPLGVGGPAPRRAIEHKPLHDQRRSFGTLLRHGIAGALRAGDQSTRLCYSGIPRLRSRRRASESRSSGLGGSWIAGGSPAARFPYSNSARRSAST